MLAINSSIPTKVLSIPDIEVMSVQLTTNDPYLTSLIQNDLPWAISMFLTLTSHS